MLPPVQISLGKLTTWKSGTVKKSYIIWMKDQAHSKIKWFIQTLSSLLHWMKETWMTRIHMYITFILVKSSISNGKNQWELIIYILVRYVLVSIRHVITSQIVNFFVPEPYSYVSTLCMNNKHMKILHFLPQKIVQGSDILDDVLWIDFSEAILNKAFRSPDHKTFF